MQTLERSQSYKDLQYEIHFELAVLNIEKAISTKKESNRELITAFDNYLSRGFTKAPDKALALYKRGNIYAAISCINGARQDLEESIKLAETGNLIFWGDGIYLKKDQFIRIVKKELDPLKAMNDHCILEEHNAR